LFIVFIYILAYICRWNWAAHCWSWSEDWNRYEMLLTHIVTIFISVKVKVAY